MPDIGGFFVLLYLIFLGLTTLMTRGQMENYLVSELFKEPADNDNSFGEANKIETASAQRKKLPSDFYNEIQKEGAEVLDRSRVSACCLGNSRMG